MQVVEKRSALLPSEVIPTEVTFNSVSFLTNIELTINFALSRIVVEQR